MINHIKNAFLLSNSTVFRMYKILLLHIWLLHCTFYQESLHTDMDVPLKIFNFKPTWDRALADALVESASLAIDHWHLPIYFHEAEMHVKKIIALWEGT